MSKNKIFLCKTNFPYPLKLLIEVLQNVIPETTLLIIGKNEDSPTDFYGLEISTNDPSKTIYIRLQLFGYEFTEFYTKVNKYNIGINLSDLNSQITKTIDNSTSSITLSMYENDKQKLNINIQSEVKSKNDDFKFKLMDLNYIHRKAITTTYDVIITIPNADFHKICKEMNSYSEYIDIKCTANQITFTAVGDITNRTCNYNTNKGVISIEWNENVKTKLVQGIFESKNIVLFHKCSTICKNIVILMKNDYILSIIYEIASLGKLSVSLSPVNDEHIQNSNYNYSDDEIDDDIKLIESVNEEFNKTSIKKTNFNYFV
jgi:proliferating cell nuclear antigen